MFAVRQILDVTRTELSQKLDSGIALNQQTAERIERLEQLVARSSDPTKSNHEDSISANNFTLNCEGQTTPAESHKFQAASSDLRDTRTLETTSTFGMEGSYDVVSFEAISLRRCDPCCKCQCHRWTNIRSYSWLQKLCGRMFLSYSSLPIFSPRLCNSPLCMTNPRNSIHFTFFFPKWLLLRSIAVSASWSTVIGVGASLHLNIPRVIKKHETAWHCIRHGDIEAIQRLISCRDMFPTDCNSQGKTLAMVNNNNYILTQV